RSAIQGRMRRGRLFAVHRGVYAVGRPGLTLAGRRRAALLACGESAVLSHRTAADVWQIRASNPGIVDVTLPSPGGRTRRPGIRVHRSRLPPSEITQRAGLVLTAPARTLIDLAAVVTPRGLERALDEAERLDLFAPAAVEAALESNRRRPGRAALAAVLAAHRPGTTRTRSGLEERFLALCRSHGIPQPEVNVPIGACIADFLWRSRRLIVETDGRAAHGTAAAFERDRARDARLTTAGYRVVRYTSRRLSRQSADLVFELRLLLGIDVGRGA
ncbi:MAG: endonuclease domain-containing protein, partial [Actinomycetota bacterium]|nr:endonuclease domain-containing protein [Actinomycetota bacterium]